MKNEIYEIYEHLDDEISKEIFTSRYMYSLTGDRYWAEKLIGSTTIGNTFLDNLKIAFSNGKVVLFGTGLWGRYLVNDFGASKWKYAIDNNPKSDNFLGIPLFKCVDFLKQYENETIVISSRLYNKEMYKQLVDNNVPVEKIINVGAMDDVLVKNQYFDLPQLKPKKSFEVFVDGGCFDGMSSVYFSEWCNKSNYKIYAFEPDNHNSEKVRLNFEKYHISNEIISKGIWNEPKQLHFSNAGDVESSITDSGETIIDVDCIDNINYDSPVTFIKMDIEGAELNALKGAEKTIKRDKPRLAISIYHKPEDIIEIPKLLLDYNNEYKFYLRHYSLSWFDTVLYAIPKAGC